ncbi:cell division protein FtsL [Rhodobacter lacus]|uniref:Cell division protein FtsL n=1 Tax=Rhodobacter lacus TaxID=1641972 RepID=A0ABW5AB14_9RHOB
MKTISYLLAALVVLGLAFWAYHVNYATKDRLAELRRLDNQIADLQEGLSVLRAEWAYLNRPERLRELVNLNFVTLGLLPLAPEQFGAVAQVAYPQPEPELESPAMADMGLSRAIDVVASNREGGQ